MVSCLTQADQVCLLPGVELGLLAKQSSLGLCYLHPFSGAEPDQVGFELRVHGQHVEQQPSVRIVRVVPQAAETETDLPSGELISDRSCVGQRPGKPVELGDHKGVAFWAGRQGFAQSGPVSVGAGQAVIDVNPSRRDTQCPRTVVWAVRSCWSVEQRVLPMRSASMAPLLCEARPPRGGDSWQRPKPTPQPHPE